MAIRTEAYNKEIEALDAAQQKEKDKITKDYEAKKAELEKAKQA